MLVLWEWAGVAPLLLLLFVANQGWEGSMLEGHREYPKVYFVPDLY